MKVLLATDGSFHGNEAASFLAGLSSGKNLEVTIHTASFEPEGYTSASTQPWLPEFRERESLRVEMHHEEVKRILEEVGAVVTTLRTIGNPRRDVLAEAKRMRPDLIVVGARGHSAIGRILLGSTSDYIATHADCSVLVVRSKNVGEQIQIPEKVTIAYDGSAGSRDAIAEILEWHLDQDTEASILSVAPSLEFFAESYSAMIEQKEAQELDEKRLSGERIASQIATQLPHTDAQVVKGRHVGESIVVAAEENDSDLIVVGETGHNLIAEWILGSTSKYVLRHAPCSVWISRRHRYAGSPEEVGSENCATQ